MRHITRLFQKFTQRHRLHKPLQAARVCVVARSIIQETLPNLGQADHVRIQYVKDKTLHIQCATAPLAADLQGYTHDIIAAVNDACDGDIIERIRISQA